MAVSLRDIAKECGVSAQTVSLVLSGKGRVSESRREEVLKTANKMGYRPNTIAQTMRSGRFHQIGVIFKHHASLPAFNILKGVSREMESKNIAVAVTEVEENVIVEHGMTPKLLRELSSDGLIVDISQDTDKRLIEAVESTSTPVVWINTTSAVNTICPDDYAAGALACSKLINKGCKNIIHFSKPLASLFTFQQRYSGSLETAAENNVNLRHYSYESTRDLSKAVGFWLNFLKSGKMDGIDGFIVDDNQYVQGLIIAMTLVDFDLTKKVQTAAICAEISYFDYHAGIDFIFIPYIAMGRAASNMLLKRIENPKQNIPSKAIPFMDSFQYEYK